MAITVALLAAASFANCLPDDMTASPVLARVTGSGRSPFYRSADCRDASCSEGVYVVPGDEVIVHGQSGGRSCVFFERTRETSGWVDSDRLAPDPAAGNPPLSAWAGDWRDGDDHIRLTSSSAGQLDVSGDAYWPGAHVPRGSPANWPHLGDLDGTATVAGNRATYDDGDGEFACKVTMRLLGRYLAVDDNGNCGGANVRFRGVYRR